MPMFASRGAYVGKPLQIEGRAMHLQEPRDLSHGLVLGDELARMRDLIGR